MEESENAATDTAHCETFVVSLCLSSSSDEHHCTHSCLGTAMQFGAQNILVILVHLWFIFIRNCFSVSVVSTGGT